MRASGTFIWNKRRERETLKFTSSVPDLNGQQVYLLKGLKNDPSILRDLGGRSTLMYISPEGKRFLEERLAELDEGDSSF